ncbi:MAG: PKD domain-containing protein [Chitinophagaceae bacterium]|nr:PKD domain-containing protein [Chitinophagaceae bacterium]
MIWSCWLMEPLLWEDDRHCRSVKYGCINSVNPGFLVLNYSYEAPPLPDVSFTALREQRKVFFTSNVTNTTSVIWDFGDGTTSTQRNPVHTYNTPGNFTVRLIGQNSCGADTATSQILYNGIQKILPEKIANNQFQVVVAKEVSVHYGTNDS